MKLFLVFILSTMAVHCTEYHYNVPKVSFQLEDVPQRYTTIQEPTIIKGNFGRDYEVTMLPSQELFKTRLTENLQNRENIFQTNVNQPPANQQSINYQNQYTTINHQQQPGVLDVDAIRGHQSLNHYSTILSPPQQPAALVNPNPAYYPNNGQNLQQPFNEHSTINPKDSSLNINQYSDLRTNTVFASDQQRLQPPQQQPTVLSSAQPIFYHNGYNGHLQPSVNQYSTLNPSLNTNQYSGHLKQYSNQQQQQQYQTGAISAQYRQQAGLLPQQQQQYNNNAPNSNNLLNFSVNNNKYVSQSEASQLDVYPYKQLTIGSTRPFTRFITTCNGVGDCVQQNGTAIENFQHQQVLKQSQAIIEQIPDKCRNNANYYNSQNTQNSLNSLTDAQSTAKRNLAKKGTDLKDRRHFAYTEEIIPQYPFD